MLTFSNFSYPYTSNNLSGISDAIQGLPDNTHNLITPQNLRDAIYTTWINNVFKQTTASGSYYIGLDSDSAGSILTNPFYFGKRNYLGSNVMNSTLLNNGTDVFFFNNKPDSITQSTIVTFLAGNPTLFNNAPYIITAATNSGLDISVINPNGNINLMSASTSNIYLNGYQFPSISSTGSIGQALILGSNNVVSWRDISSNFAYNNPKSITVEVGGIKKPFTFSNLSMSDILTKMFYPDLGPSCTLGVTTPLGSGNLYEVGSLTSSSGITYNYTIYPGTTTVVSAIISGSLTSNLVIATGPGFSGTYSGSVFTYSINNSTKTSYSYVLTITDIANLQATYTFGINTDYPYYYGTSTIPYSTMVSSFGNFNLSSFGLSKNIGYQSQLDFTGTVFGYMYYIYPSTYGKFLSTMSDQGGDSVIANFQIATNSITPSTHYWNGVLYYIYYTNYQTNPTGKYTFS